MSTEFDHQALVNVFGTGAGESGGSPKSSALASIFDLISANRLNKSSNSLRGAETIPELRSAIGEGKKAQEFSQGVGKAVQASEVAGGLKAISNVTGGNIPNAGQATVSAATSMYPPLGMASMAGDLVNKVTPGNFDPINKTLARTGDLINQLPGAASFNQFATDIGQGIKSIPGMETVSNVTGGLSKFPDEILDVPSKIYRSFRDADKNEATSRDAALTKLFTQEIDGRLYISRPTTRLDEKVVGVDLPGNVNSAGVGSYSNRYSFPADEGKTTQQLFEEFQNSETYKGLIGEKRGLRTLAVQAKEDAAAAESRSAAVSELSDPIVNVQPVATHADLGMGTHYSDEYGVWDVETGEAFETDLFDPAPGYPIKEPIPFEAPTAPTADPYQPPKPRQAVETAPRILPVERPPLDREFSFADWFASDPAAGEWRYSPSRKEMMPVSQDSAPKTQDLSRYEMLVKQEADRKAERNHTIASNGYAAPGMGWNFNSSPYNAGLASNMPTNPQTRRLPELTTGRHSSSY
jgi:hypothetical protein